MSKSRKRQSISPRMRMQVFIRDHFTCQYCGNMAPFCRLEVDHQIALANGGEHRIDNFVTACSTCNIGKGVLRTLTASKLADIERGELAYIDGEHLMLDGDPYLRAIYGELVV